MRSTRTNFAPAAVSRRRGFTFIEVLAVIVILAGMWVLVLPAMGTRDDLRLGSAARVVIADLLYAQNRAISTQTTQYVNFTAASGGANGGYAIYDAQPFGAPITNPVWQQPYNVTFGAGNAAQFGTIIVTGVSLGGNPQPNTVLAFNELGQPMACTPTAAPMALTATGTITLQSGDQTMVLSIEPDTGNITTP
ncbi:MAG TPA: prepilin-type N-terminal cleavage/methylation domain-containing protein [Tepidisphaeraceae bacterium]|nr:prepilin-type N-terminal cleavage/methylation domain-containing protein [Tepidisphaeraceae bacterium]